MMLETALDHLERSVQVAGLSVEICQAREGVSPRVLLSAVNEARNLVAVILDGHWRRRI